jgi:hypothetical protein
MVTFSSRISLLIFFQDDLPVGDQRVLKSPTTTVLGSISVFKSFCVCLIKLGALMLGSYKLMLVISSCCVAPFISMKSFLTYLSLNSTLLHISIATPACFLWPLTW